MTAKEYLLQVAKIDTMIENKQFEKAKLEEIAMGVTAKQKGEAVKASSSKHKMANAIDGVADIDMILSELLAIRKSIVKTVEQLNGSEYKVLHDVYIKGSSLKSAAVENKKSYSWVKGVHKKALDMTQEILDGREIVMSPIVPFCP